MPIREPIRPMQSATTQFGIPQKSTKTRAEKEIDEDYFESLDYDLLQRELLGLEPISWDDDDEEEEIEPVVKPKKTVPTPSKKLLTDLEKFIEDALVWNPIITRLDWAYYGQGIEIAELFNVTKQRCSQVKTRINKRLGYQR